MQSNLVVLRVVVHDIHGKAIGGLTKTDFQVFDNKEPQVISHFEVEAPTATNKISTSTRGRAEKEAPRAPAEPTMPQRFMALFFDDYHLQFGDLVQIREAAKRYLANKLDVGERAAIFSRENLTGLPFELHTQFFKASEQTAKISVIVRADIRGVRFRKEDDRSVNNLTLTVAFFDQDGNYVTSKYENVNLRLRDTSFEELKAAGLTLTTHFDLKPGSYVVRAVLQESISQQLGASSENVEIP